MKGDRVTLCVWWGEEHKPENVHICKESSFFMPTTFKVDSMLEPIFFVAQL